MPEIWLFLPNEKMFPTQSPLSRLKKPAFDAAMHPSAARDQQRESRGLGVPFADALLSVMPGHDVPFGRPIWM